MSTKIILSMVLALSVALLLFGWFFWPTPYQFTEMKYEGNVYPIRINRITHSTQMLFITGWVNLSSGEDGSSKPAQLIPDSVRWKLEGRGSVDGHSFIANIYNGSDWVVTNIDITLTIRNSDGSLRFSRRYKIWCTRSGNRGIPLTSSEFSADLGEYLGGYYEPVNFEWNILSAFGYRD